MLRHLFNVIVGGISYASDPIGTGEKHFKRLLFEEYRVPRSAISDAACRAIVENLYRIATFSAKVGKDNVMCAFTESLELWAGQISMLYDEPEPPITRWNRSVKDLKEGFIGDILRKHGVEAAKL